MEEIIKWLDQVEEYDEDDALFGEKLSVQLEKALASDNKKELIEVADRIICNGYDNGEQYAERILFKAIDGQYYDDNAYIRLDFKTHLKLAEVLSLVNTTDAETAYGSLGRRATSFDELKELGESIIESALITEYKGIGEILSEHDSIAFVNAKDSARKAFQKALDTNPSSSDYINLCESICNSHYLNDKVWAKELIKKHIAFEDQVQYKKIIDLASMDYLLGDVEFTKEIVKNAKEQCSGFDDYLELFNQMDNGSKVTQDMLVDALFDTIEVLENDDQKEQLVNSIECTINENTVEIIKTKSISELKEMYGQKNNSANSFDDELELTLPPLEEFTLDTNKPQHSLDECFDWIRKLKEEFLSFNDPIAAFEEGDYDTSLKSVEDLICWRDIPEKTNTEYMASFKKHIEIKKNGALDEELTLSEPQELELILETPPEPSPQQTNPSDLKTQYANKIASGEIDPIETSYADFEAASQNKEIDYKAVYSQMISEGRIDPTETTYDEMILVSKLFGGVDEAEYKATYSKYIVSGEIDPSETTYDEIVNIANIFNEINGGGNSKDMMDEIYQYLMKNVNNDNDYLAGDFLELKDGGDSYDFCNFAREMYDFELDFEKIKYLLDRSYELAQSYDHYKDIANVIMDSNSPDEWSEWAKELYKESESKVESVGDILDLAYSVGDILEDVYWARKLYKRAENDSKTFRDMINTADAVSQFDGASKTWAKEIYQKAKGLAEEFDDYITLTNNVSHDMYLGDKDWGKELFEEAKEKATDIPELQALIELLINDDNFDDQEYGKKLSYEALDKCNDFDEYLQIVYGTRLNKELHKEIILKVIAILETDEEKNKLCNEIEYWQYSLKDDDQLKIDIQNLSVQELKSKYAKPSTDELKKLYAQGIGSGEIDPVEVSFDSFEKNYKA